MKTVSMLEFRRHAERVIQQLRRGERLVLTYRGEAVARLEPIADPQIEATDPFYALGRLADRGGEPLTNRQIDEIVYGS
jgi:antitoxin (DNA-binding transcriptional repressor) of toxin-antitoxin stability system